MTNDDDRDLHRLIDDLRDADSRNLPTFESILARPRARRAHMRPRRPHVIATAIAIAAALVLVVAPRLSRDRVQRESAIDLGSWQSPTAFLLEPPQSMPSQGVHAVTGSVIPDIPLHISTEKSP